MTEDKERQTVMLDIAPDVLARVKTWGEEQGWDLQETIRYIIGEKSLSLLPFRGGLLPLKFSLRCLSLKTLLIRTIQ